jgi:2-polyprenyl-3-methyl-5-hydroxy-6-metoxy-1,4-benzoquinol methylase
MFKKRSYQAELLDNDTIPTEDLYQNLRELAFINTYLGGHSVVLSGIQHFENRTKDIENLTIYEIGSGGGDNLRALWKYFFQKKKHVKLCGIDLKKDCIRFAEQTDKEKFQHAIISYQESDYQLVRFDNAKPNIIFNSLFCHHFTDEKLIEMLRWMQQNSTVGFYICDLHRHSLAYFFIKYLTKIFSKSYLVKNDAPLSVLRGFTRKEWKDLLAQAGIKNYQIKWKWAFRWLIIVEN